MSTNDDNAIKVLWIGVVATIILFLVFWALPARSSVVDVTPEIMEWSKKLTDKHGRGCCSMQDGRAMEDPEWRFGAKGYQVRLGDRWLDVEDDAVVTEPNIYGPAVIWASFIPQLGTWHIHCFLPGAGT